MQIKIKHLTLTNFKCYRHKEFTFNDDVTIIRGRHGLGKTTTADAIFWCLFGKNSMEQHNFSIKTKDADGQDIPHLDHAVEMTLQVEDALGQRDITLSRTVKEVWVKKRGTTEQVLKNNTTEYLVNGDAVTAKDYEAYINGLVTEELFRTITNPQYFPSIKWNIQRDFLSRLAGDISAEDIANDEELRDLVRQLGPDHDIIAHRKHLSYQIKKVKEKLDKIPVRLEEQNKALPELLDWTSISIEAEKVKSDIGKADKEIIAIKSGGGADVERENIRSEINAIQQQLDKINTDERNRLQQLNSEHIQKISNLTVQFNNLLTTQRDLESKQQTLKPLADRVWKNAEQKFSEEQEYVRKHWPDTQRQFADSDQTHCPVCHQPLPPEQMAEAEQKFNLYKAELKQKLTDRAAKAKADLAESKKLAEEYERQYQETEQNISSVKQLINETFAQKQQLEKQTVPTLEETLSENDKHKELVASKSQLEEKLRQTNLDEESQKLLEKLQAKKEQLANTLAELNAKLSSKSQYDRIHQLIADIHAEQQQLLSQLSDLERQEDVARRYTYRHGQILEDRINAHFQLVRWRMFRTVNNGGEPFEEPYCECYVDGIPYHDGLNQAHRMNAGIDIIRTLCRYYDITAPIIIDQAESNLAIPPTDSQQIRLQVYDSDLQVL